LEDAFAAYLWLIEEQEYDPGRIIIAGDSAGGGLSLALLMYLRDNNYPLPLAAVLMSPWTDLTCSGSSHSVNFKNDPLFGNTTESMLYGCEYIGGEDPRNPYISPLFGHYDMLPPMLFQVGGYEVLLSDSEDAHRKALADGCDAVISIYPGMFHEFQMSLNMIPESKRAWEEVDIFVRDMYKLPQPNRSKKLIKNPHMQNLMKEKLVEIRTILEKEKEQN
jgi:acetyl esterase/lipase